MDDNDQLKMSFDPNTIEHLGVRMYSTLPPVLAELIANSYDADASRVTLDLNDEGDKEIVVTDDGIGMSFQDINNKFLRIGRNRRSRDDDVTTAGRKVIGKKGLGKLSFFGISREIEVTTSKDGLRNVFRMRWDDIRHSTADEYRPQIIALNEPCDLEQHGTTIALRDIQRVSDFLPTNIAISLAKIFIIDDGFTIEVRHNNNETISVTNQLKYDDLVKHIEWNVPGDIRVESTYDHAGEIRGHLIATIKPIPPSTHMRGITLYSRSKMVNTPEYFADSTSSHFFSYLTGWLEVDFIDDLADDVISTDRQSLDWDHPEMAELREYLRGLMRWLENDWRSKRSSKKAEKIESSTGVNVADWLNTVPSDIRLSLEPILNSVANDAELSDESTALVVEQIHAIIPEYPRYHWRQLHPEVRTTSQRYYESGDYYTAVFESVKRYLAAVKIKAQSAFQERTLLENVFSISDPKLSITDAFRKSDGTEFSQITLSDIKEGHRGLALGAWLACRNPIAHEEVAHLRESGLFTEHDCLDALGLISHLYRRLDSAVIVTRP